MSKTGEVIQLRPKSNRQKVMNILAANKNHIIPASAFARRLYGDPRRLGPVHKVMLGLETRLKKERCLLRLRKVLINGKVLYGLFREAKRK